MSFEVGEIYIAPPLPVAVLLINLEFKLIVKLVKALAK